MNIELLDFIIPIIFGIIFTFYIVISVIRESFTWPIDEVIDIYEEYIKPKIPEM